MAYFDPNTTVDSKVRDGSIIPIKEGQFLITTDTRSIFYDLGDRRIQLTDILELNTEAERKALIAPVNKFYFIKDSGALWRYNNGAWIEWPSGGSGGIVSKSVNVTLTVAGWINGSQTVSIDGLTATQNGVVGIAQDVSTAEMEAARTAEMYVSGQTDGAFTIALGGDKPTFDIPITVILLS